MKGDQAWFESGNQESASKLNLTRTEARLLEVLRSQPGRVFRRSELVTLVMPDAVVLERTIDAHIRALRKKLGPLACQIETIRKTGYRFVPDAQC